jgi:outer membrane protein assembly factor BamB
MITTCPMSSNLTRCAVLLTLTLWGEPASLQAGDWPQWRGPLRNGTSAETGLLASWPREGPRQVWKASNAGSGYSTPAVSGSHLYLLGNEGLENESVLAFSAGDGTRTWATRLGNVGNPQQKPHFPGARSTPTIKGDHLFALGSDGDLACLELATGRVVWTRNLRRDFGGKPGTWAYAESPLVDGEHVICTPGGPEATIVSLEARTGNLVWKSSIPDGGDAAYASAIRVDGPGGGAAQYVQQLQKGLVGIDAATGKALWRYGKSVSRYGANIPSPLEADGVVYVAAAGTGGGAVRLRAGAGATDPEELYFSPKLPAAIGGTIKVGGYLYGTTAQTMVCLDFKTGEIKWEDRSVGASSLCHADGRLYLHTEGGEVVLVDPSPEGYREKGRFTPSGAPPRSDAMEKAWAYPVVANGRLYIREHATLWCFALK